LTINIFKKGKRKFQQTKYIINQNTNSLSFGPHATITAMFEVSTKKCFQITFFFHFPDMKSTTPQ